MSIFNRSILTFFCLLLLHLVYGQVINTGKVLDSGYNVTEYVGVLKTTSLITIDSVLKWSKEKGFEKGQHKKVVFAGYDQYYYWFRMILNNPENAPQQFMLLLPPVGMREGELFQKDSTGWRIVAATGYKYDFEDRPYLYAGYVFPFTLRAKATDTLYLSMDASHAFKSYGFFLMKPKPLRIMENRVYFSFGVIVGILALFFLFNLYLYFMFRDKIHLWYSVHIALLILIVLKHDQLDQQFLDWDSEIAYTMTSILSIAAYAIAILMHVILHFLVYIQPNHLLHKITDVTKWNVVASGTVQLIVFYLQLNHNVQNWVFLWCQLSTLLGIGMIIVDCGYNIRKDRKSAFFLIAILLFLIGAIYRLLLLGTNLYFKPPHLFHYGMVLETFIITFGLIYQYRLARRKKNQYLREKEIIENSRHKLLLESRLEIQEQTLRTSLKEINTGIGQKIARVKENVLNLRTANGESVEKCLNESKILLGKAIADLRNVCKTLDTDYIRDLGLLRSIEYELEQCRKAGACNTELQVQGEPYKLDRQKELILFRMYQELLNEINKYYPGGIIVVELNYDLNAFQLNILLAGSRMLPSEVLHIKSNGDLQNRASLIGGGFSIEWTETHTKMIISLPAPMMA